MSRSFKDKVVIVTGSSSGVGAHAAIYFAYNYASVVLTGRNVERLNEVFRKCKESGVPRERLLVIQADVTRRSELARIVDETVKKFGKIDILINNAGEGKFGGLMQSTADDFDKCMETNVKSVLNLTKLATPHLIKTKGNVVNVSSLLGSISVPAALVYSMAKASINQFTKCVAMELAPHGVRVNAICPSYVEDTRFIEGSLLNIPDIETFNQSKERQHPLHRNVRMEDCTKAIAFLASEDAAFITGTLLPIDGGRKCTDVSYAGPMLSSNR
ncbi:uncharacterized oxidoreductase TM_0325-like [Liolophura sinensis]|uniref:uncharacterized oxidoreductase TM_0325-like n=1 Tax=Liolophura sinensis TaxID=3198878 RepID=UPI00315876BD